VIHLANAVNDAQPITTSQWLPAMLVSLGIVIMLVLWTMSMRGRIAKRNAEQLTPREQIDRIKAGHQSRNYDDTHAVEFVTRASEIAARLDNKAERLEQLLAETDDRIMQLRHLLREASETQSPQRDDAPSQPDAPPPPKDNIDATPPPPPPEHTSDPLTRSVWSLADAGRTPVEIAQELNEQVGKVELILALRSQ
jgi:hypothetical protein